MPQIVKGVKPQNMTQNLYKSTKISFIVVCRECNGEKELLQVLLAIKSLLL